MVLSINVAVLLAVIIVVRLRRRTHARSRNDEKLTVVIVLVFGVLIAPTALARPSSMSSVNSLRALPSRAAPELCGLFRHRRPAPRRCGVGHGQKTPPGVFRRHS